MVYTFKFYVNNDLYFASPMEKRECVGRTKSGARCLRNVFIGQPYCFQHMVPNLHLKIKPSTLPNAGKGLFAWFPQAPNHIVFQRNQQICDYEGEFIDKTKLNNRYGEYTAPYAIAVREGTNPRYEDAALHRGIGSLANHNTRRHINASFVVKRLDGRNHHIALKAIRPISHGDEIFVDYGAAYLFHEPTTHTQTGNLLRWNYFKGNPIDRRNNI